MKPENHPVSKNNVDSEILGYILSVMALLSIDIIVIAVVLLLVKGI